MPTALPSLSQATNAATRPALDAIPAGSYAAPAELLEPADEPQTQQPADAADVEAAVAALLLGGGSPGQLGTTRPASASATSLTGSPRPVRASSQLHLSLEAAVADALGDLAPASPSASASCCQTPAAGAWASPTAALCAAGRDGSVRLSSPWRTSSSGCSAAAEAEASKRFSVCGLACPALETIREQTSLLSAAATSEEEATAASGGGPAAVTAAQEERSCEDEVAALLGGGNAAASSGAAPPCVDEFSADSLDGVLALLEGGSCPPAPAAGACTGELGSAVAALLAGGSSPGQVAPRLLSTDVPVGVLGRLASVSSEEEREGSCAAAPPKPAPPASDAEDGGASSESSWAEATQGVAAPTSGVGTVAAAATATAAGPARAAWAPPAWWTTDADEGKDGTEPLAQMYARAVRDREVRREAVLELSVGRAGLNLQYAPAPPALTAPTPRCLPFPAAGAGAARRPAAAAAGRRSARRLHLPAGAAHARPPPRQRPLTPGLLLLALRPGARAPAAAAGAAGPAAAAAGRGGARRLHV